ncbi:hypothetical protein, partial [Limnospira platensis]|uniref:hypothetical protein n=1 Tax=Limnospira platensis TaxID=118562 RepID=UPI003395B1D3
KGLLCLDSKTEATTRILSPKNLFSDQNIKFAIHEFLGKIRGLFLGVLTKTTFCAVVASPDS